MWILKYEASNYPDAISITLFNSEEDACKHSVSEIQCFIEDEWDMSDLRQATEASLINDFIRKGKYTNAVNHWNMCSLNMDSNYPCYWTVYEEQPCQTPRIPHIFDDSFFTALLADELEEEKEDDRGNRFVATTCGATCRGNHREYNEYAYADRPDGTYLCHQCKMFQQMFGGIKP